MQKPQKTTIAHVSENISNWVSIKTTTSRVQVCALICWRNRVWFSNQQRKEIITSSTSCARLHLYPIWHICNCSTKTTFGTLGKVAALQSTVLMIWLNFKRLVAHCHFLDLVKTNRRICFEYLQASYIWVTLQLSTPITKVVTFPNRTLFSPRFVH